MRLFLLQDKAIGIRVALVIILVAVIYFARNSARLKNEEFNKIDNRIQLVISIPKMEEELRALGNKKQVKPELVVKIPKDEIKITGVYLRGNTAYTLIGGRFYAVGDIVGDYSVVNIASDSVTLLDRKTQQKREFRLPK